MREQQMSQQREAATQQQMQQQQQQFLNNSIRTSDIRPLLDIKTEKPFDEKAARQALTLYEVYTMLPKGDATDGKEKKEKKAKSKGENGKQKPQRWAVVQINSEQLPQSEIVKAVKSLDAKPKSDVVTKVSKLFPNQSTQVTKFIDDKSAQEPDPNNFEWVLAQLQRTEGKTREGDKYTQAMTLYMKRQPRHHIDCLAFHREQEQRRRMHANQRMFMLQQQQRQQQMQHEQHRQQQAAQAEALAGGQIPIRQGGPQVGPQGSQRKAPGPVKGGGKGNLPAGIVMIDTDSSSSSSDSDLDSDGESSFTTISSPQSTESRGRRERKVRYPGDLPRRKGSRSKSRHRNRHDDFVFVESPRGHRPTFAPDAPNNLRPATAGTRVHTYGIPETRGDPFRGDTLSDISNSTDKSAMESLFHKGFQMGLEAVRTAAIASQGAVVQQPRLLTQSAGLTEEDLREMELRQKERRLEEAIRLQQEQQRLDDRRAEETIAAERQRRREREAEELMRRDELVRDTRYARPVRRETIIHDGRSFETRRGEPAYVSQARRYDDDVVSSDRFEIPIRVRTRSPPRTAPIRPVYTRAATDIYYDDDDDHPFAYRGDRARVARFQFQ
jgi:hypothetical protein